MRQKPDATGGKQRGCRRSRSIKREVSGMAGTLVDPMPKKEPERVKPDWLAVVQAALTEEACYVALRYAWGRVELMKRADVVVQEDEAHALANDAIADTLTRVRAWEPARVKLTTHLCGVIRSRTNARIARVRKIRHESIEAVDENWEQPAEIEASLATGDEGKRIEARATLAELAAKVLSALREAADGDGDLIAMLETYERGTTQRQDLMLRLGWDDYQYMNVKRRLDRLVRDLPPDLRRMAAETMGSGS